MSATPSTYPEDAPVIELTGGGPAAPHPTFACHAPTEFGDPRRTVRAYVRAGHPVREHKRLVVLPEHNDRKNSGPNDNVNGYAPPTNPLERETGPGGRGIVG